MRKYAIAGGAELIDIGANITRLRGAALEIQLTRASDAGVKRILVTGTSVPSSNAACKMCLMNERHPSGVRLYFTAGVHPHDASTFDSNTLSTLRELSKEKACVAVGETGLDYDRMRSKRETQLMVLRTLVSLSVELDKPLFLHERDLDRGRGKPLGSHTDMVNILEEFKVPPSRVCIHCFTADKESLRDYVARGYYIGITGFVGMKKRGQHLREALSEGILPIEQLMIETDAPYMQPDNVPKDVGLKGRNNEPCTLPFIVNVLADCYRLPPADVANHVTNNTIKFFTLH